MELTPAVCSAGSTDCVAGAAVVAMAIPNALPFPSGPDVNTQPCCDFRKSVQTIFVSTIYKKKFTNM